VPPGALEHFCLDDVQYAGHKLAILWDSNGIGLPQRAGLRIFVDGREVFHQAKLATDQRSIAELIQMQNPIPRNQLAVIVRVGLFLLLTSALTRAADQPETLAIGASTEANPALGGKLGTCFDVALLQDGAKYRMWFSWRPQAERRFSGEHGWDPLERAGNRSWTESRNRLGRGHQPSGRRSS
jgi:hypothetical protein